MKFILDARKTQFSILLIFNKIFFKCKKKIIIKKMTNMRKKKMRKEKKEKH